MNGSVFIGLVLILYFSSGISHAEVYRWLNDRGEIVFGDAPPEGTKADSLSIDDPDNTGMKFATPEQIEKLRNDAKAQDKKQPRTNKTNPLDSYCRRYRSDLNKIEIYLEHTNSMRDVEKARDLRKLIKRECGSVNVSTGANRSRCESYRQDMVKTQIYLEHTPNPRDKHKVEDLRKQIARECE